MKYLATAVTILIAAVFAASSEPGTEERLPSLDGSIGWLNSLPLNSRALSGKVVVVNFWTYSCINSLRELPYMKAWAAKYKGAGLVVLGVHTPEFGFEKDAANVKAAVSELNALA